VESVPGRLSGAWVYKETRMPVAVVFENLEVGSNIEEIMDQYDLTRDQIQAVDHPSSKLRLIQKIMLATARHFTLS
jgi:uncharacterized protein (DUF433 family)